MTKLSRREREKKRRETDIIDAAEIIFARDGFENASMNAIANKAEFSKRTLYKYFEDKIDLYLTVALRLYEDLYKYSISHDYQGINGYEQIRESFDIIYDFYVKKENSFRIIYDIGMVRQLTDNPKLKEFLKIDHQIYDSLHQLILKGQSDGSINKDISAQLTARTLMFLLISFFNQLTITGKTYTKHIDVSIDEFISTTLDQLQSILK
jgi:AcrR family transcriptional regulator